MVTIPQKELRNHIGEVLRRVEAGESLIVTVAGRPVAELSPARRHRWVGGAALTALWHTEAPLHLAADLEQLGSGITDPFTP